ncbi:P-loop containing nucleoside triphosphate hydrolase protein [Phycomyces nitens]|nr:P-loop containing nucleoside triphosphate hydrolase protein [Phycomyces nitens]
MDLKKRKRDSQEVDKSRIARPRLDTRPPFGRPNPAQTNSATRPTRISPNTAHSTRLPSTLITRPTASSSQRIPLKDRVTGPRSTPSEPTARSLATSTQSKPIKPRAQWDLRGRIGDMQSVLEDNQNKIEESSEYQKRLMTDVVDKRSQALEAAKRVADLEALKQEKQKTFEQEVERIKAQHHKDNRDLEIKDKINQDRVDVLKSQCTETQEKTTSLQTELDKTLQESTSLKAMVAQTSAKYSEKNAEFSVLRMEVERLDESLASREKALEDLQTNLKEEEEKLKTLKTRLLDEEKMRRKLHNSIQELKGNIRVFCRVRPPVASEKANNGKLASMKFYGEDNDKMELSEEVSSTLGKVTTKTYLFSFDKVFSPGSTQEECFEEISQLVQSALDGYNVCIFAYGQTGSGKTYTMEGQPGADKGMIPRAVQQIYQVAQQLNESNWHYTMEGQFMEIYNETVHDLLGDCANYGKIKHEIRHEKSGKTLVTDMTSVLLDSPARVNTMLRKASQNRATGATNMNERSSRSHSVFMLRLNGDNPVTGERTTGVLNLIDLAGSERLAMSGSTGNRLKETQAINKSLSCLGDVISALLNNKEGGHIPYRNSKLTYLLQNSLGGNSKTLMFVNISPLTEHFNETLCSLRFATKVNSCRIGTARRLTR